MWLAVVREAMLCYAGRGREISGKGSIVKFNKAMFT